MSDLVKRLRGIEKQLKECLIDAPYLGEAATEIERLTAENEQLRHEIDVQNEVIERMRNA